MNMRLLLMVVMVVLTLYPQSRLSAQVGECSGDYKKRVMLIGDSWAHFTWLYQSFGESLKGNGFADIKEDGNRTALISMQAETWASEEWLGIIQYQINLLQDVDIFVVFIGGNDVMWKWRPEKPMEDLLPYTNDMLTATDVILDKIFELRPNAQVIIASYDYPNFAETMIGNEWNPYYDQWVKFGFSPPSVLNPGLIFFEDYRANYPRYKDSPNIHHINNIGVAQYYGGYPTPSLFEPFGTFPPKSVPLPFGDPNYPTHPNYMGLFGYDAYHFNATGYQFIANNIMRKFLSGYLRSDYNYSFNSVGSRDGWVSSVGTTGKGDIKVGKQDNAFYAGIYTFNTSHFPAEAIIDKGSLFLTRKSLLGTVPSSGMFPDNIVVEMKAGHFGANPAIEADDYSAPADFQAVGCVVGSPAYDEYKIRIDLSPEVLAAINTGGDVQFRIKFNHKTNAPYQLVTFFNGDEADKYNASFLDLRMSELPEVVGVKNNKAEALVMYPNPTSDVLNFDIPVNFRKNGINATIYNSMGSVMKSWQLNTGSAPRAKISLAGLPSGAYLLQLSDGSEVKGGSIIVQK